MTPEEQPSIKAEQDCIGWLLAKPDEWHHVLDQVRPEDFYVPINSKALTRLLRDGHQSPDELAETLGGIQAEVFRTWMVNAQLDQTTQSIRKRAERVADLAARRRIVGICDQVADEAINPDIATEQVVHGAHEKLEMVATPDTTPEDPVVPIDVFMARADDEYDWIIPDILERRDRLMITANGGIGKSTFLRQLALCVAAGIHPFTGYPMPPKKVMLLDLENSERQVRRKMQYAYSNVGPFNYSNLHIVAHPKVIDVTTSAGWRWMAAQARIAQPDLIVGGPVYRMYLGGDMSKDMGGRDRAREVVEVLDRLRGTYNCAIGMEAHPPNGAESFRPHGSALWTWWPEFGLGLKPDPDPEVGPSVVELVPWRVGRDERDWPKRLRRGGKYGFAVV